MLRPTGTDWPWRDIGTAFFPDARRTMPALIEVSLILSHAFITAHGVRTPLVISVSLIEFRLNKPVPEKGTREGIVRVVVRNRSI